MNTLPLSWAKCQFGEVASIVAGGTPNASEPENFQISGGIPWITPADLSGYRDKYVSRGARNLSEIGYASCSAKKLPAGTVVFSSRAPIGYVAIAKEEISTNQGFKNFVLPAELDSTFVYYYLQHIKPYAESIATGTTFKEISGASAAVLPLLIAPLAEQKRIAAKLDTTVEQVQRCRDRLARVSPILKRLRQSILAMAVSGRLTQDWREEQANIDQVGSAPGETSVFDNDKCDLPGVSKADDIQSKEYEDTEIWPKVFLGDVATGLSYGSSAKSERQGAVPVLRMGNIQNGKLDWNDLVFTSDPLEIEKYRLEKGDLLFNRTNSPELVGKTAVYKGEQPAIYAGYLIRVKCTERILPDFLNYCLRSPAGRHYCWQVKSDGVSQSNINAKKLAAFRFGLPPVDEQTEIIRRAESLFALVDSLQTRLTAARNVADQLIPALLAKAFRGELAPQDPDDEHASELVERLIASHSAEANKRRRRAGKPIALAQK